MDISCIFFIFALKRIVFFEVKVAMDNEILCPVCARKGIRSLLARACGVSGSGHILLWCKKCKKEIRISIEDIRKADNP